MWKRFDPSLRRVVTAALRDAAARGQNEAGLENLLVALSEHPPTQAAVRPDVLDAVEHRFPRLPSPPHPYADRLSDDALATLDSAHRLAGRRGNVRDVHL